MKQFVKVLLFFSIIFFIVDKAFYWKIENLPKKEWDKRLEWILEGKMNKDILIFGSSRAQHGLYADAIQDSLNLSTHNLGYRGSNIDFQLFLLKKVLKYNKKPKIILLTLDDYREFLPDKTLQFRYDKLYPLVKYQEITNDLINREEVSPFGIAFYCARMGREQFLKSKRKTKYDNWTPAGTSLLDFTATDFNKKRQVVTKYETKLELPELLAVFKEFQNICKAQKIKLYILIPPNFTPQNKEFVIRMKKIIISKNTHFYNENLLDFKNSKYFSDQSHLNKNGAILYTNEIIKRLKTEF